MTAPVCAASLVLTWGVSRSLTLRASPSFANCSMTTRSAKPCLPKVGPELQARGFKVNTGTIVEATVIGAPSSAKTKDKACDPEMHQIRKGQQWYFGMKLHIGVDSQSALVHSAVVTAANIHDKHPLPDLLHGN